MSKTASPTIRQMESLLQEKLIPWTLDGAPLLHFGTPPRGIMPFETAEAATAPLSIMPTRSVYPHVQAWESEELNSIDVPVLGCIFDGQSEYQIRRPPSEEGTQWTIPVQTKTIFLIPPGIPFTRGVGPNHQCYARGILIHLRRDCISCFTYTLDQNKVWQAPYVLLHEFDAQLLAWRLLEEWKKPILSTSIIYHYTSLIFELMLRSIQEKRFTNVHGISSASEQLPLTPPAAPRPAQLMKFAKSYINEHLESPDLCCADIALNTGISARHLERLFKQTVEMPPFQYVQQQRLKKACVLLLGPEISVQHVAYYCGFRQASHFSKWFSRQIGVSPRAFRQQQEAMSIKDMRCLFKALFSRKNPLLKVLFAVAMFYTL